MQKPPLAILGLAVCLGLMSASQARRARTVHATLAQMAPTATWRTRLSANPGVAAQLWPKLALQLAIGYVRLHRLPQAAVPSLVL